jgi:hypothetical protein
MTNAISFIQKRWRAMVVIAMVALLNVLFFALTIG